MAEPLKFPPLKPLHPDSSLNAVRLAKIEQSTTKELIASLLPGKRDCLKPARMELYWMGTIAFTFFACGVWMSTNFRGTLSQRSEC
jgi:hypothetical protein